MVEIEEYRRVQSIAKSVLASLAASITSADTERSIAGRATSLLATFGVRETWYHDCPALVLSGSRSCLSVSGREYQPSEEVMGPTNLVTVDLSPSRAGVWGDCARSFFVEGGACVDVPTNPEFVRGAHVQRELHASVLAFATPATTFRELFEFSNALIESSGFENLDFLGNVGHSIESTLADRRYVEAGNDQRLGSVRLFTFEPHIRTAGGSWGFKHENIYYFAGNELQEL